MEVARTLVAALEDKKGEDIVLMDISNISQFTDYFIICTGSSERMLQSLSRAVDEAAKTNFGLTARINGKGIEGWITLDFGDLVVHLFSERHRAYYQLEDLWAEGKTLLRLK
ncbi:MAG TPA: ribosome silencing factor [Anaerolineaceae bacterium]|nr:ribosome silencing factor [Anaerolineaceae bacterium]